MVLVLWTSSVKVAGVPIVICAGPLFSSVSAGSTIVIGGVVPGRAGPLARVVLVDPVVGVGGGVGEAEARHVRGRVLEHDRDLDDDLLAGRDVDPDRRILDHQVGGGAGVDGRPGPRARDLRDAHEAQVRGRGREVVRDPDVVERVRVGRRRDRDPVAEGPRRSRRSPACSPSSSAVGAAQLDHDAGSGSSSPATVGVGLAVDVGVVAVGERARRREQRRDWFVTSVPSARVEASVMSNWITIWLRPGGSGCGRR